MVRDKKDLPEEWCATRASGLYLREYLQLKKRDAIAGGSARGNLKKKKKKKTIIFL